MKILKFLILIRKDKKTSSKERNFERIFFQNFLGAYATIEQSGVIKPVDILDISKDGLLFQSPGSTRGPSLSVHDELTIETIFYQAELHTCNSQNSKN